MLFRFVAFALFALAISSLRAQQALDDGLPAPGEVAINPGPADSSWLDLRQNKPANAKPQSAPRWVEAVSLVSSQMPDGSPKAIFRIRVAHPVGGEYDALLFRLFFDDQASARPELVCWDESGTQVLRSGALGSGLGLPTSESQIIPMNDVTVIDIEVPGDGKGIRGAYLDWMTSSEVVHPVSVDQRDLIPKPFSAPATLHAPKKDVEQFGTVTASLAAETIPIGPDVSQAASFQFDMEAQPLVALLTFDVASPRIDSAPEVYVNGESLGPVNLIMPDLADPGYRGEVESMVKDMQFQYTGWLRAQKVIPLDKLKAGTNDIMVVSGAATTSSAIRSTQIQLKYLWDKSDYQLRLGK